MARNYKIIVIKCFFIVGLFLVFRNSSYAIIVFDPLNLVQNSATALQTLETYQQDYQNLTALKNINTLLASTQNVVNQTTGSSNYALLNGLNPNSGSYQNQRDAILQQYFHQPADVNEIIAGLSGILSQDQLQTIINQAQHNQSDYQRFTDTIDVSSSQRQAQNQRLQYINQYNTQLNSLGGTSSLQTQQTSAAELNLLLQQHEAEITSLSSIQQAQGQQIATETSAASEDFEEEQARLVKASQQGTSGFGKDLWGNY